MTAEESHRDAIGISLQMLATFMAALAYVLQKKAHLETTAAGSNAPVFRHKKWQAGFAMMAAVAVIDIYSFSLLDQSKQAAMGAVTLAWNTILAACFLKESFTVLDAISVVIIMAGTILGLSNASAESADFTFAQIIALLDDTLVKVYTTIVVIGIATAVYYVEKVTRHPRHTWTHKQAKSIAVLSPGLGGMCMGFTGYGAKAISTVIFNQEWEQFKSIELYCYVLISGVAVSMQVRYLNKGLEFFDALQVVPIFQSTIIFSNAMAGIMYYHDMRDAPAWKLMMFGCGGLICILGICLLLLKTKKAKGAGHAIPGMTKEMEKSTRQLAELSRQQSMRVMAAEAAEYAAAAAAHAHNNVKAATAGGSGGSTAAAAVAGASPNPVTPLLRGASSPGHQPQGRKPSQGQSASLLSHSGSASSIDAGTIVLDIGESAVNGAAGADADGGAGTGVGAAASSALERKRSVTGGSGRERVHSDGAGAHANAGDHDSIKSHRSTTSRIRDLVDKGTTIVKEGIDKGTTIVKEGIDKGVQQVKDLKDHVHLDRLSSLGKPKLDPAVDWPEGPYNNDGGSGGTPNPTYASNSAISGSADGTGGSDLAGLERARARTRTSSTANLEPAIERWWDLEVSTALRLTWRRLRGNRYGTLEI